MRLRKDASAPHPLVDALWNGLRREHARGGGLGHGFVWHAGLIAYLAEVDERGFTWKPRARRCSTSVFIGSACPMAIEERMRDRDPAGDLEVIVEHALRSRSHDRWSAAETYGRGPRSLGFRDADVRGVLAAVGAKRDGSTANERLSRRTIEDGGRTYVSRRITSGGPRSLRAARIDRASMRREDLDGCPCRPGVIWGRTRP